MALLWPATQFSRPYCTHTAHELGQSSPPRVKAGKRRCLGRFVNLPPPLSLDPGRNRSSINLREVAQSPVLFTSPLTDWCKDNIVPLFQRTNAELRSKNHPPALVLQAKKRWGNFAALIQVIRPCSPYIAPCSGSKTPGFLAQKILAQLSDFNLFQAHCAS